MKGILNMMEFKRVSKYDINITHTVNGGMIVKVGCAVLTFSNPEDMMDVMKQYYENPDEMEKLYNKANCDVTCDEERCEDSLELQNIPAPHGPIAGAGNTMRSDRRHH